MEIKIITMPNYKEKITVIHNVYKRNPFIHDSIAYNLGALEKAKANYQYIVINDKGDKIIKEDITAYLDLPKFEYVYSPINYGKGLCAGGWVAAIPHIHDNATLIHRTDQDDVMTEDFYLKSLAEFEKDPELSLTFTNAYKTDAELNMISLLCNPNWTPDYSKPLDRFREWFGVNENGQKGVTRANNNIPGLGVIYKKHLHNSIGIPDVDNFAGACDFEYWARILFYQNKCKFINEPLWLYRQGINGESSEYSAGHTVVDGKPNRGYWQELHNKAVQEKYTKLWEVMQYE